jgi:hypothetical protein
LIRICSSGFFWIAGTTASGAGYPTGISRYGFSFFGRPRIDERNPIGLGVCVNVVSPATCRAVSRHPHTIPTDSATAT